MLVAWIPGETLEAKSVHHTGSGRSPGSRGIITDATPFPVRIRTSGRRHKNPFTVALPLRNLTAFPILPSRGHLTGCDIKLWSKSYHIGVAASNNKRLAKVRLFMLRADALTEKGFVTRIAFASLTNAAFLLRVLHLRRLPNHCGQRRERLRRSKLSEYRVEQVGIELTVFYRVVDRLDLFGA